MNLHDVVTRALRGGRFAHTELAWASVVRATGGQYHLYEMPILNGRVACTVMASLWGDEVPTPQCGKKPRASRYAFSRMHSESAGARPWMNYCRDCIRIEDQMARRINLSGWWSVVRDEAGLEAFYEFCRQNPAR